MARTRSPERELAAFQRRVEALFRKEERCPACAKMARENADTMEPKICEAHQRLRARLAFAGMRD